jgi:cytochrome c oxidase cbb3-type subunit 3
MSEHSSHPDVDVHTGTQTTGHEWDGIKELNTPLPRWWLILFYACTVIAIIYMVLMPAWPALPGMQGHTRGVLDYSDRDAVAVDLAKLDSERAVYAERLVGASLQEIEADPDLQTFARAAGESAFGDNCATCHGAGGRGAKGYPVLADDAWLWGGTLEDIQYTLIHGIRAAPAETRFSAMPAFGRDGLLKQTEINDLVEHLINLSGGEANVQAAARGADLFATNCVVCHGENAQGDQAIGAPNLTDGDWLYGGERREIYASIYNPRNSVMPYWSDRIDPATIKALAIYVHSLGGGEG